LNKIFRFFLVVVLFLISIQLISACSDSGVKPQDVQFVIPDSNISFYDDIEPMLELRCGLETGCHSPTDARQKLLYIELINKQSLLDHKLSSRGERLVDLSIHRQHPELAPLYLILKEGYPTVLDDQMPPPYLNRAPLTDNQIEGIRRWIGEGAPD
jgi:hypothetical protein